VPGPQEPSASPVVEPGRTFGDLLGPTTRTDVVTPDDTPNRYVADVIVGTALGDLVSLGHGAREDGSNLAGPSSSTSDVTSAIQSFATSLTVSAAPAGALGVLLGGAVGAGGGPSATARDTRGTASVEASSIADAWNGQAFPAEGGRGNGTALDLSRTNELLQQLIDEVKTDRQPYLPVNGREGRYE
jgi:hypothetical protein